MSITRKLAIAAITAILGIGIVGATTPAANADWSWHC